MSKKVLADAVQELGFTNGAQSIEVVSAILRAMKKEFQKSKEFRLLGFGTFVVAKTKSRVARNPRTGDTVQVPAGSTVRFKASKILKRELTKPSSKTPKRKA